MEPHPSTISELESELQRCLASLHEIDERGALPRELKPLLALAPPDGASVHVSLRQRESGRQLRLAGPIQSWSPRVCGAWVVYELPQGVGGAVGGPARPAESSGNPLEDFIAALDHVERDPHLRFVSLKWFRDTYLPRRGYDWANDPDLPRQVVHEAAETEMILTSKVPNPKTPEFPVTTIQLNRTHPQVQRILAALEPKAEPPAAPARAETTEDADQASGARKKPRRRTAGEGPREEPIKA